ncbi:MAG: heavy-metal-associated domain-containing protein [Cytophaga sp.]|uniref:heavy-metal-associated domain-containing protein n=1 Tax=Cytophaga sp. TaxID=29535 RepID=UPI003F7D27C7
MFQKSVTTFVFFICLSLLSTVSAQIDTVRINVDGLTCSSCSKAVEQKLLQVFFVKSVVMNLNRNEATVLVDFSQQVNWNVLAKAVYDAGFSVGSFKVPACQKLNNRFNAGDCSAHYLYIGEEALAAGQSMYTLVGKFFMDKKDFATWKKNHPDLTSKTTDSSIYFYY